MADLGERLRTRERSGRATPSPGCQGCALHAAGVEQVQASCCPATGQAQFWGAGGTHQNVTAPQSVLEAILLR